MRASAVMALRAPAARRPRPVSRAPWRRGPMARPRRLVGRTVIAAALFAVAATVAMAMLVVLANRVVNLRRHAEDLRAQLEFEETRLVTLEASWVAESSRAVVTRRAADELGLVEQADPSLVVVMTGEPVARDAGWRRWVDGLGEGVQAASAQERRP